MARRASRDIERIGCATRTHDADGVRIEIRRLDAFDRVLISFVAAVLASIPVVAGVSLAQRDGPFVLDARTALALLGSVPVCGAAAWPFLALARNRTTLELRGAAVRVWDGPLWMPNHPAPRAFVLEPGMTFSVRSSTVGGNPPQRAWWVELEGRFAVTHPNRENKGQEAVRAWLSEAVPVQRRRRPRRVRVRRGAWQHVPDE